MWNPGCSRLAGVVAHAAVVRRPRRRLCARSRLTCGVKGGATEGAGSLARGRLGSVLPSMGYPMAELGHYLRLTTPICGYPNTPICRVEERRGIGNNRRPGSTFFCISRLLRYYDPLRGPSRRFWAPYGSGAGLPLLTRITFSTCLLHTPVDRQRVLLGSKRGSPRGIFPVATLAFPDPHSGRHPLFNISRFAQAPGVAASELLRNTEILLRRDWYLLVFRAVRAHFGFAVQSPGSSGPGTG